MSNAGTQNRVPLDWRDGFCEFAAKTRAVYRQRRADHFN